MGYRISYGKRQRRGQWWWLAVPGLVWAAAYAEGWYWAMARYVGACIRGG